MEIKTIFVKQVITKDGMTSEVTLSANLEEGDDPTAAFEVLRYNAQKSIHQMIDEELESVDQPPIYYKGPRYTVAIHEGENLAVILPDHLVEKLHYTFDTRYGGRRLDIARKYFGNLVESLYKGLDCTDGNLTDLPELDDYSIYTLVEANKKRSTRYLVLVMAKDQDDVLYTWSKIDRQNGITRQKIDTEFQYNKEVYESEGEIVICIDATGGRPDGSPRIFQWDD